ncbi:unnamed protein product (macronuclear) [Paramecium tetraurelia]|uniref:RING-type domain-containing protein n=1 Tax=Paramecium tetraurelia TaxID=5888 RepID=A0BPP8_PARTE|nr:uncharacterized protein GSPATT00005265001 [Paramecium tetraurelia]CAK60515.1 unnamed protein product [Paramecium tetraurelia]|eukprot:XP_001427913.1 hypothetical protein (macronuclear) [Paramecium tetraurelia strain d4-2]
MKEDIKILSVDCNEFICSICFQIFTKPIKTTCGHNFCIKCITKWVQKKKHCPCCRKWQSDDTVQEKDEILAEKVSQLEVACLKCNKWTGLMKELKTHRFDQCTTYQSEKQSIQYQLVEDDSNDNTSLIIKELLSIKNQQNFIQLMELENEEFVFEKIPIGKKTKKIRKRNTCKNQDQDVQLLQEDDIIKLKQSENYITKQINKRFRIQQNLLKDLIDKKYKMETYLFFVQLFYNQNEYLLQKLRNNNDDKLSVNCIQK